MRSCSDSIVDALVLLGIAAFGLLLTAFLLPPLEQGRTHARNTQAWNKVRQFAAAPNVSEAAAAERDPWGQPYRVTSTSDGRVRVVSSGPNEWSPPEGFDADDICSDMPESPNAAADRWHNVHMFLALLSGGATFMLLLVFHIRSRYRNPDQNDR